MPKVKDVEIKSNKSTMSVTITSPVAMTSTVSRMLSSIKSHANGSFEITVPVILPISRRTL